jgi:hypothetical protein
MSALPPKADIGERDYPLFANSGHRTTYSITLSTSCWSFADTSMPSTFAVLRL